MKIYFAASIRGGRDDVLIYKELINHLKSIGTVLTEHISDKKLSYNGEKNITDNYIHDRDINWLKESDVLIAEVTTASLGVGYEIRAAAYEYNKPVLCLKQKNGKRLSAMINGSNKINVYEYANIDEAKAFINTFISQNK